MHEENIGYRYDEDKEGNLTSNVIPQESRLVLITELSCIVNTTCEWLLPPTQIATYIEFDHEYYSSRDQINLFSLGQLNSLEVAREAAALPLAETLGKQISELIIFASWLKTNKAHSP